MAGHGKAKRRHLKGVIIMAKKQEGNAVTIMERDFRELTIPIIGQTGYIPRRPQRSAVKGIPDEHGNVIKTSKNRDLDAEYEQCFHYNEDGEYAIPGAAFLEALCEATKDLKDIYTTTIRRNILVLDEYCKITEYSKIRRREDFVKNSGMTAALNIAVRPEFLDWKTQVRLRFDNDIVPKASLLNLMYIAGQKIGVGAWRPERGGRFGTFTIGETNA